MGEKENVCEEGNKKIKDLIKNDLEDKYLKIWVFRKESITKNFFIGKDILFEEIIPHSLKVSDLNNIINQKYGNQK